MAKGTISVTIIDVSMGSEGGDIVSSSRVLHPYYFCVQECFLLEIFVPRKLWEFKHEGLVNVVLWEN